MRVVFVLSRSWAFLHSLLFVVLWLAIVVVVVGRCVSVVGFGGVVAVVLGCGCSCVPLSVDDVMWFAH